VLSFLPLHAAGVYENGASVDSCSDYLVLSSTPTLSALLQARKGTKPVGRQAKTMLVGVPHPFQYSALPSCTEEIEAIKALLPSTPLLDVKPGSSGASMQEVLDIMPHASIAHFACHGRQDPENAVSFLHYPLLYTCTGLTGEPC
jgi:CHAT domain-containing protein